MKFARTTSFALAAMMTAACTTGPLTLNDNLVVPGERIGEIQIGMTLADLLALKGIPTKTIPIPATAATTYFFDGLTVAADDRVYWIIAKDSRFRTDSGVAPGVEQIFARAAYGQPDCVVTKATTTVYDYGNFYFDIENSTGIVRLVGVQDKTQNCDG